jgi:hypothetical protein
MPCASIERFQSQPHLLEQIDEPPRQHARPRDEHRHDRRPKYSLLAAIRFPQPTPGPVARDATAYAPAHSKANLARPSLWPPERHKARPLVPIALLKQLLDFRATPEPLAPWQR